MNFFRRKKNKNTELLQEVVQELRVIERELKPPTLTRIQLTFGEKQ